MSERFETTKDVIEYVERELIMLHKQLLNLNLPSSLIIEKKDGKLISVKLKAGRGITE